MQQRFGMLWLVGLAAMSPRAAAVAHKGIFDEDPFFSGKQASKQKGVFGDDPFFSGMGGFGRRLDDDRSGLLMPGKGSKGKSSSVSSETVYSSSGGHPGRFLARTKRCKNGECVVEERRRDTPAGKTTLSEKRTKAADGKGSRLSTDAELDAEGLRIRKHMKDMNRQMNRQMNHHMQSMDSFFKDPFFSGKQASKQKGGFGDDPFFSGSLGGTKGLFARGAKAPAKKWPQPGEVGKLQAIVDGTSKDLSQDKSRLLNSVGLSKNRLLNDQRQHMDSSSNSMSTRIVNGHVVQKKKTCHNGKCHESVVEGDAKNSPGDTALSEKRTKGADGKERSSLSMDAEALRIRKRMKDMNRQMHRRMKHHMQSMDSFFKGASSLGGARGLFAKWPRLRRSRQRHGLKFRSKDTAKTSDTAKELGKLQAVVDGVKKPLY